MSYNVLCSISGKAHFAWFVYATLPYQCTVLCFICTAFGELNEILTQVYKKHASRSVINHLNC